MTSATSAAPRLFWWTWSVVSTRPRRREIASRLRRSTVCSARTPMVAAGVQDYGAPLCPPLHEFPRTSGVPVLAVWGRDDEIFGPAGAQAFARDAEDAEVHLIDGGHFLLEGHLHVVAGYVRGFLGRVLGQPGHSS